MLGRIGYQADLVVNGVEVLDALTRTSYDIILMDLHMPLMGGLEAAIAIRSQRDLLQPVIVALTASATTADRDRCLNAGMDDYLCKPIEMDRLRETIWTHTPSFAHAVPSPSVRASSPGTQK
jgi:CheY-like chemotaxis protein